MEKTKQIFIVSIFLLLLSLTVVTAVCTVTLDKENYFGDETSTATMSCSSPTEKNKAYTLTWRNSSNDILQTDTGTTPNTVGESFFETFTFPNGVDYLGNVTLTGSSLEGFDTFVVNSTAGANALLVTNLTFTSASDVYLLRNFGMDWVVKDDIGKKLTNARCQISFSEGDDIPIASFNSIKTIDGRGQANFYLNDNAFNEGREYLVEVDCFCGNTGSGNGCIDEDGLDVNNSIGTTQGFFSINTYATSSTRTDRTSYSLKDELFVCANVTNTNYPDRLPLSINYNVRCSAYTDGNANLDRVLVAKNQNPELRGISKNTSQNQCARFIIPEAAYLQGHNSECYAATDVSVLNENFETIVTYSTTSPIFFINSTELNLNADWVRLDNYTYNAIINLSATNYIAYNGSGTGNLDINLATPTITNFQAIDEISRGQVSLADLIDSTFIYDITATGAGGAQVTTALEYLEDGFLEIELKGVDISRSGYYNVTFKIHDWTSRLVDATEGIETFENRSATALEGIENKTGTFHFDVDCPAQAVIGEEMDCTITAYVEETQVVEKEVDFTCYIQGTGVRHSTINFNSMVTRTPVTFLREFSIPSSFTAQQEYSVVCKANYYNLGSRQDTFQDTFIAIATGPGGFIGAIMEDLVDTPLGEVVESFDETIKEIFEDIAKSLGASAQTAEDFSRGSAIFFYLLAALCTSMFLFKLLGGKKRDKKNVKT